MQRELNFGEALAICFSKYCCFEGRASRSEYWWWVLFNFILSFVLNMAFIGDPLTIVSGVTSLALLLPGLGVAVRRLHDIGKGGGYIFLALIPLVGPIILIVWFCRESEMFTNRFGDIPYEMD